MTDTLPLLLPTVPGKVHGIVSLDPPTVQCDGCAKRVTGPGTLPVLDADGLPVVRTVGDLTARHIGKRVRLDEHYDAKLETIFAHEGGDVSLNFTHSEGFAFGCSRTLDTPCEVLS